MSEDIARSQSEAPNDVVWGGAILALLLVAMRAIALAGDLGQLGVTAGLWTLLAASAEDLAIVLGLVFAFTLLGRSLPHAARWPMTAIFLLFCALVAIAGLANIPALRLLGAPLTLDWVRYSDLGHTGVIFDSLLHLFPLHKLLLGAVCLAVLYFAVRYAARSFNTIFAKGIFTVAAAAMLIGFIQMGRVDTISTAKMRNPIVAFAASLASDGGQATIDRLAKSDAANLGLDLPFENVAGLDRPQRPKKPLKNVLVFAFESTPAKQAQGWGGRHPVTPNLLRSLENALAFDRAYAHVPTSNAFLISAFASMVPELSPMPMANTRAEFDYEGLANVLNQNGFRTAFFNSSDNRFQNTETFAQAAGFDQIQDYRDWSCESGVYEHTSISEKYLITSSDLCTADRIIEWIAEDKDTPFFAAFRTGMTRYPYFPGENPQDFGVDNESYNSYLNALHVGDAAFGRLLDYLDRAGLAEETLVVLLGDRGETFGEHGTFVHAAGLYEENVHIPLALINPQLFHGTRSPLIVGLKDVAPTITDLLQIDAPRSWQGHSVFAPSRPNGVMLFTRSNGIVVGYRHGNEKLIFNANSGETALFDLASDPEEQRNLTKTQPETAVSASRKLAKLVASQRAYIRMRIAGTNMPAPTDGAADLITVEATGTRFGAAPEVWVRLDGKDIDGFTVSNAPSNEMREVPEEDIVAAMQEYVLHVDEVDECPRRLEIYFLNDNWAGAEKTGDTDLWVRSVRFDGHTYHNTSFNEIEDGVGHKSGDFFKYSRNGGVYIDLYPNEACLSATLETPAQE